MGYQVQNNNRQINIAASAGVFAKNDVDFCTKLLLENVETKKEDTLCDLGAGSGVVGIWHAPQVKRVVFVESDLRTFKTCRENIRLNKIKNAQVFLSDIFMEYDQEEPGMKFSLILTNPPVSGGKHLTREFISEAYRHMEDGGRFYLACRNNLPYDKYTKEFFGNVKIVTRKARAKLIKAIK